MRTRLNDGRDLRRGSITGTQPGKAEKLDDAPVKPRRNRDRFKPGIELRVSAGGVTRPRGSGKPVVDPRPVRNAHEDRAPAPPPVEEWDNPYRKRKMDKGTALHLAALRKSREKAASDPHNPVDRAAIIRRDDKTCWICRKRLEVKEIELDHVVPLTRGGKHVPENLRVACKSCNTWHGDRLVQPL